MSSRDRARRTELRAADRTPPARLTGEMRFWAPRLLISAAPLALTPVLFALVAAGVLSFGGGEKDLALLAPWGGWSLLFLVIR